MVTTVRKRPAGWDAARIGRLHISGRKKRQNGSQESLKGSLVQLKSARSADQRSSFSIAISARSSGCSTARRGLFVSQQAPSASSDTEACGTNSFSYLQGHQRARRLRGAPWARPVAKAIVLSSQAKDKLQRTNSVTSNSVASAYSTPRKKFESTSSLRRQTASTQWELRGPRLPCASRRSSGSKRQPKTVSITASQEGPTTSLLPCCNSHSELSARRSIIKLRPLPSDRLSSQHNEHQSLATSREAESGLSLHQQREQKIFSECRFLPADSFYKKVIVAPCQDRQFFAAPKCVRVCGSRMHYDIAKENWRHHQDVNFDFTRDSIKRVTSNYSKPSNFRHN